MPETAKEEPNEALVEVRGRPTSVSPLASPQSLLLNNQTVFVDDQTVFSGLANFNAITTTTLIQIPQPSTL